MKNQHAMMIDLQRDFALTLVASLPKAIEICSTTRSRPIDALNDGQLSMLRVHLARLVEAVQDTIHARRSERGELVNRN